MNSQVNSSGDFYVGNFLVGNQNLYSGSIPSSNNSYAQHVRPYGLPMYQPNYNLNAAPMAQTNQMPSHLENVAFDHISTPSFLVRDESSSFRKNVEDNFISLFQDEAPHQHCDELLQSIVESSCVGSSTPFKGTKDLGKHKNLEIDLNRTPEQRPPKRRQHMPMALSSERFTDLLNLPLDETLSLYEETQENFVTVPLDEATQKRHNELLKDLTDTLSAPTPTKELEKGNDQVIDLNQTPEQKTPKRRKHRPKVIKEGKPKKSPKPVTPKIPKETPSGKRKYVRKKNITEAATPPANVVESKDSSTATKTKSCRRVIHFEMEKTDDENQEKKQNEKDVQEENMGCFITRPNVPDFCTQSNGVCGTSLDVHISHQHGTTVAENVQPTIQSNFAHMNHMTTSPTSQSEREAAGGPLNKSAYMTTEDFLNVGRILDQGKAYQCQNGLSNGYSPVQQHIHAKEMEQFANHAKRNDSYKELMGMNFGYPQTVPNHQSYINEARGSNRGHLVTIQPTSSCSITTLDSSVLCQEGIQTSEFHRQGSNVHVGSLEIPAKKFESGRYATLDKRYSTIQANEGCSSHLNARSCDPINYVGLTAGMNQAMLNSYIRSNESTARQHNWTQEIIGNGHIHSAVHENNFQRRPISHNQHPELGRTCETAGLNNVTNYRSLIIGGKCNSFQPFLHPKALEQGYACRQSANSMMTIRQACQPMTSGSLATNQVRKQGYPFGFHQFPDKTTDLLENEIIRKMKGLNLNDKRNARKDQNAIVPYKGNGAVVPFEEPEYLRKRKARPRVDLDPETERIWNLLMGNEGTEGIENHEKGKEKWWEEERKVFRGRADSFIARMHLVQGDRTFSRWKGSVVDSVIGVFLTQNVSDHLSSSAFMSLAARFPVKSTSNIRTQGEVETSIVANEPAAFQPYPADSIRWDGQLLSLPRFEMPQTSMNHQNPRVSLGTEMFFTEIGSQILEEEIISSQDSFDSTITQVTGGARSCSGSNSEAEEPIVSYNFNSTHCLDFTEIKQTETTTMKPKSLSDLNNSVFDSVSEHSHWQLPDGNQNSLRSEWNEIDDLNGHSLINFLVNIENQHDQEVPVAPSNNQLNMNLNIEPLEVEGLEALSEESASSGPSIVSGCSTEKHMTCHSLNIGDLEQTLDKTRMKHGESVNEHSVHLQGNGTLLGSHCNYNLQGNYEQCVRNKTSPLESASVTNPSQELDATAKMQNSALSNVAYEPAHTEKLLDVVDRTPEKGNQINFSNNEVHSLSKTDNEGNISTSKAKKRKVNTEKNSAIDWDSLRKQVEANGQIKEKGKDAMDSIDYEAIRQVSVHEVSSAIKERGMNNMLAERIKEFLDRLVTDHGSIDLEWLRDVPPDKAKDYLLSVRGLGLKSVECVRLLTLHNLAFPVDTNVGRIAVRLGWVPLQPLPESLQLHLLELYPMLETIQKYLWPRLCKLDQRTLYELHYQLITFGKVFCTKSKPNCNACPMRGECKHFASAFASARLALPAPDEKRIVTSTSPVATEKQPAVVTTPLTILPPVGSTHTENNMSTSKCEPIVEVPATPEPEPAYEITESDIEDAFYEDPDEIPTIKLSMEEFKTTLQNYIPEGDMSRALVALNPEAAFIPTPKLKNVSRLRTEHQVYELPDSHPLLKEMDIREPDDPSPYLLAIWTPGETANSIQPPEQSCGSQDPNRLCNEKTCFTCSSRREANSQTVRGTLLIPCRTAMRGSFPLNGTYFQVNEMFADHESSANPIDVPRKWLWNLPRRTVYFGTSVTSIFKGLVTEEIQQCFWRGFVCVRGFERKTRAPRPLIARLHFPAFKLAKMKNGQAE